MASQGSDNITETISPATSRLAQMKMRFQQKQQLEREQRRVEMTSTKIAVEETTSTTQTTSKSSSSTKALNSSIVPGKVRQMFDERRRGTGIDKSYPLKPLSNNNNNNMNNQRSTSGSSGGSSSGGVNSGLISKKTTSTTINSINRNGNIVTNKTSSTITSTKPLLRTQQHPVNTINSTISGNLRKTPLNGRLNASSIQGNSQRTITTTTTTTAKHNNMQNNTIDYDNDDDDVDNDNDNDNNYNNNNNNNDYNVDNDDDDNDYVDNDNNENFTAINEGIMNENSNNLDDENFSDEMNMGKNVIRKNLPNVGKLSLDDRNNNAGGDMKSKSNIKLKPVITRKTLPSSPSNTNTIKSKTNQVKNAVTKTTGNRSQPNITEKPMKTMTKNNTKMLSTKVEVIKPVEKVSLGPPPEGMAACSICGRHFNIDRIEKHETICQRAANKKRKIFDSTKHRVKGTEAEIYLKRVGKNPAKFDAKSTSSGTSILTNKIIPKPIGVSSQNGSNRKSNWRIKHEEFINAIRAAKEVQKHLAKGGKLSDLPPPPPSENPDYIQCPHCSRRFNEAAANRHIPKCADMLHNKPKNKPPPKKKF